MNALRLEKINEQLARNLRSGFRKRYRRQGSNAMIDSRSGESVRVFFPNLRLISIKQSSYRRNTI